MFAKNIRKIKCKICKKSFFVLATHLIRRHKLTTDEYLKQFPDAKLLSEDYREKVSNTAKSLFLKDPTMRQKVARRTFDFINNKKLTPLLQSRSEELSRMEVEEGEFTQMLCCII